MRIQVFVCSLLAAGGAALAQSPSVSTVTPLAVAPGQSVELVFQGRGLDGPTELWTSFRAETGFAAGNPERTTCRVTVPGDMPVGIGAVRLATGGGASDLQWVMVDDLPTVPANPDNNSPGAAQKLSTPAAVEGACKSLRSDYYRISGTRGQRVSVEVVAARLGSALDPVLRLLDSSGRELAWVDDSVGAGGDCRFVHTFASDGELLVELRDVNYEGGAGYRYRLRVGDFPLAVAPFPLGAKRGTAGMFTLLGEGCDLVTPVLAGLPRGARAAAVSGRRTAGGGSGFATVVAGELDETIESEPNDSRESATPIPFPAAMSGRFEAAGDVDYYKLALRKGQPVSFRARTRSLGVPCDVALRLVRGDGSKVAESKVEGPADASLDAKAPGDGTYWLQVAEITGAGGPALAYRIEADPYRPAFALSTETDKLDAKPGAEVALKITCVRKDFGGAIALSVEGIDPALLDGATIPAGKNETTLKVKLPGKLEAGRIVHFSVIGRAEVDGIEVRAATSTGPALRKLFPRMLYLPEAVDGMIALGVRGEKR